jgi:hypothetical protein
VAQLYFTVLLTSILLAMGVEAIAAEPEELRFQSVTTQPHSVPISCFTAEPKAIILLDGGSDDSEIAPPYPLEVPFEQCSLSDSNNELSITERVERMPVTSGDGIADMANASFGDY